METTVLVVDDDSDVRAELSEALFDEGFQVALAGDGAEALRLLRDGIHPALILLDLMMPTMNGWEFVAERAAHPELGGAPIVLMSGSRLPPGTTIPDGDFLPKPIRLDVLLAAVRRWCRPEAPRAAAQKL
jgi:CheY-like chemotaxis protein